MEINIPVTTEEKDAVLTAIGELNTLAHLKFMSQAAIASHAGIKQTKVRAVLVELIEEGTITQYNATDNPRIQRFYYVINEKPILGNEQ